MYCTFFNNSITIIKKNFSFIFFWSLEILSYFPLSTYSSAEHQCDRTSTHLYRLQILKLNSKLLLPHHRPDTTHHLLPHNHDSSLPCFFLHLFYLVYHNRPRSDLHPDPLYLLHLLDKWVNRRAHGRPWGGKWQSIAISEAISERAVDILFFCVIFLAKKKKPT